MVISRSAIADRYFMGTQDRLFSVAKIFPGSTGVDVCLVSNCCDRQVLYC